MQAPLAGLVGVPAVDQNPGNTDQRRKHQQRGHGPVGKSRKAFHKRRYPVNAPKSSGQCQEVSSNQSQNPPVGERFQDCIVSGFFLGFHLSLQLPGKPFSFVLRKPPRLRGPVGQVPDRDDSENDGRNSLQDEKPAPACQPSPMNPQEPACYRRTKQRSGGDGCIQAGNRSAALAQTKPVRQVHDHCGEKAGFRNP